jgi:cytochrome c oxidase subunit 2
MPPAVPRRFIITAAAAAALAILVGVGFLAWIGTGRGLVPIDPASRNADDIQDLYVFTGAFASAIFLVVTIPLVAFIVRFRAAGRSRDVEGPQIRGNTRLELAWTIVPVLILVVIAGFTFYKLSGITTVPEAGAAGRLDVTVEGRQFYWQYTYPNGVVAVDRLRVPVGRVVDVTITAPTWDVVHSWWVPELTGKRDAIPGETTSTWFRANREGTFDGRCGEFCGLEHARMETIVEAIPAAEFDAWLSQEARAQQTGDSDLGRLTYEGVCAKCHGFEGEGGVGPPLAGNPAVAERENLIATIENGIRQGTSVMPPVGRDWPQSQTDALVEYLGQQFGTQGEASGGG